MAEKEKEKKKKGNNIRNYQVIPQHIVNRLMIFVESLAVLCRVYAPHKMLTVAVVLLEMNQHDINNNQQSMSHIQPDLGGPVLCTIQSLFVCFIA